MRKTLGHLNSNPFYTQNRIAVFLDAVQRTQWVEKLKMNLLCAAGSCCAAPDMLLR